MSKMDQFSAFVTLFGAFMCIAVAAACIGYGGWIFLCWALEGRRRKENTDQYANKRQLRILNNSPYEERESREWFI